MLESGGIFDAYTESFIYLLGVLTFSSRLHLSENTLLGLARWLGSVAYVRESASSSVSVESIQMIESWTLLGAARLEDDPSSCFTAGKIPKNRI